MAAASPAPGLEAQRGGESGGGSAASAGGAAVEAEDLPELVQKRPLLGDALPSVVLEMLGSPLLSPQRAFEDDEAFLRFLVAKIATAWRGQEASAMLAKEAVEWPRSAETALSRLRDTKAALGAALATLERTQQQKVAALEAAETPNHNTGEAASTTTGESEVRRRLLPRFVRLVARLELTSKEVRALEYILVAQSSFDLLRGQSAIHAPQLELVGYTGMTPRELLDFASQRRRHMSQGLLAEVSLSMSNPFRLEDEFDLRPSVNRALLSAEAVKALVGANLSPSEMLKLDQSGALACVLREENEPATASAVASGGGGSAAAPLTAPAGSSGTTAVEHSTSTSAPAEAPSMPSGNVAPPEAMPTQEPSSRKRDADSAVTSPTEALAAAAAAVISPTTVAAVAGQLSGQKRRKTGGLAGQRIMKMLNGASMAGVALPPALGLEGNEDVDVEGSEEDEEVDEDEGSGNEFLGEGDDVLSSLLMAERRRDARRVKKSLSEIVAQAASGGAPPAAVGGSGEGCVDGDGQLRAYHTDLEYLVEAVELVAQRGKLYRVKQKIEDKKVGEEGQAEEEGGPWAPWDRRRGDPQKDRRRELELEGLVKQLGRKVEERMRMTREAAEKKDKGMGWVPRLERILSSRHMGSFEKEMLVLLVGGVLLPSKVQHILNPSGPGYYFKGALSGGALVGELLCALSPNLETQISNRRAFYKDSVLVRDGMIHVGSNGMRGDLTSCPVEIDRRMVDFIVGLDSEVHQLVDGSHMYVPKTKMDQVVLAADTKALITSTVQNFAAFRRNKKQYGLGETITASGLVMLFYGDSGTGKTMTANAVAQLLGKKLLLLNFPSLGGENAAEVVRMIFRESKINDAVLFFDECESIFESREKSRLRDVNMLLTELERHDGLIILATNRPYDLDEAMHRRITLAIEFHKPDHILRRDIWKALLPPALPLGPDVDVAALAMRYELTGGFIKNAILSALSIATTRATESGQSNQVTVKQEDLTAGAQLQLRGRLAMRSFERRVVPKRGLDGLVCSGELIKKVQAVVDFEKSKTVLYGQWGFGGAAAFSGGQPQIGSCVLFYGPPGTGKSLAAQAVGFEVGRPLKVVNAANVLDKYVGETGKNIEKVFAEARAMDAVLVFDEAEGLFGRRMAEASSSVDKHTNLDTGLLLHWLETYPGLCILTTNAKEAIDSAFFRRFRFLIEFPKPDRATRAKLWRSCIPSQAPLAADADLNALAMEFDSFSGGDIQNAVIRAASRAALRSPEDHRIIRMADLREAAKEEGSKQADESVRRLYA